MPKKALTGSLLLIPSGRPGLRLLLLVFCATLRVFCLRASLALLVEPLGKALRVGLEPTSPEGHQLARQVCVYDLEADPVQGLGRLT